MIPKPASIATQAYAPVTCFIMPPIAVKISSSLMRNLPVCWRLYAKMLRRSSESDAVLMCRCASWSMKCIRSSVLIRLPFCTRQNVGQRKGGQEVARTWAKQIP